MAKSVSALLILSVVLAGLAAPAAAQTDPEERACKKRHSGVGVPHRLKMIAQINAVRAWTEESFKHGADYAMWHNAEGDSIKCEKLPGGSDYYRCVAAGRPCPPVEKTATQTAN